MHVKLNSDGKLLRPPLVMLNAFHNNCYGTLDTRRCDSWASLSRQKYLWSKCCEIVYRAYLLIYIQVTVTHGLVTGPALVVIRLTPFNFVFFIFKIRRRQSPPPPSFCFAQFFIFFFDRSTCLSLSLGSWVGQNTPVLFRHWIDGPSDFVN
jgi:hypothetical protein